MVEKGRQRMIAGVNKMGGRADCSEAVVLQQRNGAAVLAMLVVFVIVMTAIQTTAELGTIVAGGIAGLVVGLGMTFLTTSYWLGYCNGDVLLVKTNRLQNKAVELVGTFSYPVNGTITSGMITKKVQIGGAEYVLVRQLEERFRAVTGI